MTNDTRPDETIENPVAGDEEISLPEGGEPESAGSVGDDDSNEQEEAADERVVSLEK